jgi:hypothetical protein
MPTHSSVNCKSVNASILDLKPVPTSLQRLGHALVEIALENAPMPSTTKEVEDFLTAHGVIMPKGMTAEMKRRDMNHMVIMIPPKQLVEAAVCEARKLDDANVNYIETMLPDYKEALSGAWINSGKTNEDFYDVRVADYTLSYCR